MGEQVEVGLSPVKLGSTFRIEYEKSNHAHTVCYVNALNFQDALAGLTLTELIEARKLTIERQEN